MNQIEREAPMHSDASINPGPRRRRRDVRAGLLAIALGCALLGSVGAAPAMASFGIASMSSTFTNQDGTTDTQAGSHPFESTTSLTFSTDASGNVTENVKDVVVNLPPGVIGDPNATPKCTVKQLDNNVCEASTQVGMLGLTVSLAGQTATLSVPLYNMVPPAGMPAQFGANILVVNAFLDVSVAPDPSADGGYRLRTSSLNISAGLPVLGISVTLWGVPADPSHDADRQGPGCGGGCGVNAPLKPFLTMPTSCSSQLTTTAVADSWQNPGAFEPPPPGDGVGPGMTGCDRLSFNSSISVQPDTTVADSPTGLNVDVYVPQAPDVADALATPDLKDAVVTLPAGVVLSPAAADGLQGCSPTQIGMKTASEPSCPDASKIGTAEIDSPILSDPLTGAIYLAQQTNNPFGSVVAIYVTVEADGVLIKLAGNVQTNPTTGQITTTFSNNPQLPFTDFKLRFFAGPRAAFATPESCGSFRTTSALSPWSSTPTMSPSDSFSIGSACVSGFSPSLRAGTVNPQAGSFSPFVLSFSRSDTDQELSALALTLPPGMVAKLAGVAECSDAQIAQARSKSGAAETASPSCPAASQVGTAQTGAGAGTGPFFTQGKVYLTGPYRGAPYGLVVVVPAVAGPLDLGTVVVRQALNIDPTDAHVTVVSDPFPTILKGIPLRLRRVDVDLNRSGFTVNPTSCDPMSISAALTSNGGTTANDGSRFQAAGCSSLAFTPKLKLSLTGKGKTKSGAHPALTAKLTQEAGQANIKSAKVTLPLSLALDPKNSAHVCAFGTAQAVHGGAVGCPSSTIVGTASATTPLLSQPLSGDVYLVQGIRTNKQGQQIRTLPSLLIPLRGQIALDLRAQTSVSKGKLVTTFPAVPDVPVSSFQLNLTGGKKGLLVITGRGKSICGKAQTAKAALDGQSGKRESSSIKMATPCRHAAKHHKKK